MNIANLYRKIKQVLNDSNIALVNRGLSEVDNLSKILSEIAKSGEINYFPFVISREIVELTPEELGHPTQIRQYAFQHCTSLESITIPNSVTTIDNMAFFGCTSLVNIYLNPTIPPALGGSSAIPTTTTIHVPIDSGDAYKSATNWSYHSARIVEDIEI